MTLLVRSFVPAADADAFMPDLVPVRVARVAALASPIDVTTASEAALREHARVQARIHERARSLPSRFGVTYPDTAALARALAQKEEELARELDLLGDRVELSIVLSWHAARAVDKTHATNGTEYLREAAVRERAAREAESLVACLVDQLATEPALVRQSICPRPGVAATVAVCTTRDGEVNVRERASEFERTTEAVSVSVYGPMPPYSFAS